MVDRLVKLVPMNYWHELAEVSVSSMVDRLVKLDAYLTSAALQVEFQCPQWWTVW